MLRNFGSWPDDCDGDLCWFSPADQPVGFRLQVRIVARGDQGRHVDGALQERPSALDAL
jgi:hypothetical protein